MEIFFFRLFFTVVSLVVIELFSWFVTGFRFLEIFGIGEEGEVEL